VLEFKKLDNGFEYLEVNNDSASAKIALQGAHLFHYERKGEEAFLWLSSESDFELGRAIRGGVPICWPSFGMNNPELSQHGFARVGMWEFLQSKEIDEKTTELSFLLKENTETLNMWNYKFELKLKLIISDTLTMELTTTNTDEKPFKITQALHTYFAVSKISDVHVKGLSNKPYLDAVTNTKHKEEGDVVFNKETDRVYQEVDGEILLVDKNRTISIKNEGSSSVIVWNPLIEKCKRMSAMNDEAYKEFVCIESANAFDDFRVLKPKEAHTLKATIC
jgi:glucose-6-phosphate 1-epimerase